MIRPLLRCIHRDTAEGAKDDIVDLPLHDPPPSAETYRQTNEQVAPLFLITVRPVHHALLMDFLNRVPRLINEICEEDSFCYRRIIKAVIYRRKRKGRSLHNRGCDQSLIRKYILMNGNG